MLKTVFILLCLALGQNIVPATSQSPSTGGEASSAQPDLEDIWLREKLPKATWVTPENRTALAWAIKKYISSGYSHVGSSINEALRHFKDLSPAEFQERVTLPFQQRGESATTCAFALVPLTEEEAQKSFAQKIASRYPHCSSEKQTQLVEFFMKKLRESTKDKNLAWKLERGLKKIEEDFERRHKKITREVHAQYPDIGPAHQEALAHFLTQHSLEILSADDGSALLERALLNPHSNAEYRRTTATQLTETRTQRDAAQQQTTVLTELLRQAQQAQATAEQRSPADIERETSERQRVLQELVAKEAAAVREKETISQQLTQEQQARAAAEAKSEECKQAVLAVKQIATESIDDLKEEIEALTKRIDASAKPKCSTVSTQTDAPATQPIPKNSWAFAPLAEWKAPTNTVWFPWLFALSLYGSNFFDIDQWIADLAEHLKLPQLRDFLQKRVIPQKVLDNKNVRSATNALLTAGMLKVVHLIMQKYGGGTLINSEGDNPNRLSPNFNTLIHLAGISYLLLKCNDALLAPEEDDDEY